jgi:hypothetical protein
MGSTILLIIGWMFILGVVGGALYILRQSGYLPLRRSDLSALGYPDIQERIGREAAGNLATYYSICGQVDALCKSRVELSRSVKRFVYDLTGEWEKVNRDQHVPAEWKDNIRYIYAQCCQDMLMSMPEPYGEGSPVPGGPGRGPGAYKEGAPDGSARESRG